MQNPEIAVHLGEGRRVHEDVEDSLIAPTPFGGRLRSGYTAKGVGLDTETGVHFRCPRVRWEELRGFVVSVR